MTETASLSITDFSGGLTDNYIGSPLDRYKKADNLVSIQYGNVCRLITRFGSQVYDINNPQVVASTRLGFIKYFNSQPLVFASRKVYRPAPAWTEIVGPVTSNSLFPAGTDTTNVSIMDVWNDHLFVTNDAFANPSKIYADGSSVLQLRTAGLPVLASNPTVTPTGATGQSFIYKFIHKYTYTVGTVTYIDRGASVAVTVSNSAAPNVAQNNITVIPVLANGAVTNWDTANIKIEIYRTTNAGTVFYRLGEVTNDTAVFTDNFSDATIQNNERMYTEGGVVENDPVPLAKLVHVTENNIGYWAHIKDSTGEIFKNRVQQSIPGDIDSCPSDFFVDVQDEIVGFSSVRGLPVALCKSSVYRIDGAFDLLGRGGMEAKRINDAVSCVSAESVVQTIEGVFWAGLDGFYFTDGYQVMKLNEEWPDTYKTLVSSDTKKRRIQGKYDSKKRMIWWTVQEATPGTDCDKCYVLHLDFGIKGNACFTTVSGGSTDSFSPTAIEFVNGDMYRGDRRGYLLIHQDSILTDPKIDTSVAASLWATQVIYWDLITVGFNFGLPDIRKFTPKILTTCKNSTNLSLQITSINDDGRKTEALSPIRFRGVLVWGDADVYWGDPAISWNFDGLIENQRRVPAKSLRCSYKQVELTNAKVAIISSDIVGNVSINSAAKTATLLGSFTWPTDPIDYVIAFENDGYINEYTITARTGTVLTYSDSANKSQISASSKFVLRGYPKGEVLHLLSITTSFFPLGKGTFNFFTKSGTGEVGASSL